MDAPYYVEPVHHSLTTATHFHSNSQYIDDGQTLYTSRKLLQQSKTVRSSKTQRHIDEADALLFTVLASAAGIAALIVLFFGIRSCYRCWKRRAQADNGASDNASPTAAHDGPFVDDDKFSTSDSNRYASDRNLAMCAELYHYEKQKRQLLALERAAQSEIETSQTPPSYYASHYTSRRPSRDTHHSAPLCSPTDRHWLLAENDEQLALENTHDEEEYAIYEYPGLVNTVGNIEIDNPLFRTSISSKFERNGEANNTTANPQASATTDSCISFNSIPLPEATVKQDSLPIAD